MTGRRSAQCASDSALPCDQPVEDRDHADWPIIRKVRTAGLLHRDSLRFGTDQPTLPRLLRVVEQYE